MDPQKSQLGPEASQTMDALQAEVRAATLYTGNKNETCIIPVTAPCVAVLKPPARHIKCHTSAFDKSCRQMLASWVVSFKIPLNVGACRLQRNAQNYIRYRRVQQMAWLLMNGSRHSIS